MPPDPPSWKSLRRPPIPPSPPRTSMTSRLPGELHDPVGLPGLTAVRGELLFPPRRCRRDVGPDEVRPDRLAVVGVVAVEIAAPFGEGTHHGWEERAGAAARPVERPFLGVHIEQSQREAAGAERREDDFVDVAAALEDRLAGRG